MDSRLTKQELRDQAQVLLNDAKLHGRFQDIVSPGHGGRNSQYRDAIDSAQLHHKLRRTTLLDREQLRRYLCGYWSLPEGTETNEDARRETTINFFEDDDHVPAPPSDGWEYSPVWAREANGDPAAGTT